MKYVTGSYVEKLIADAVERGSFERKRREADTKVCECEGGPTFTRWMVARCFECGGRVVQ